MGDGHKEFLLQEMLAESRYLGSDAFTAKHPSMFLLHADINSRTLGLQLDTEVHSALDGDESASALERVIGLATSLNLHVVPLVRGDRSLFADRISVGRTPATDLCFSHTTISKYHAYFSLLPDTEPTLTDAGSKNGTFVVGNRLEPNTPVPLSDRSVIRFGDFNVRFHSPAGLWRALRAFSG